MAPRRVRIERILCPTDFSEFSRRALTRAVGLAGWFDARVTALHVAPPPAWALPAAAYAAPVAMPATLARAAGSAEARELERFVEPFLGEGVPVELKLVEGEPWREIQSVAEALPADLVVMGTHGRSGVGRLLLGSVAEKVLRRVPCPVLTVGAADATPARRVLFERVLCAVDLTAGSEATLDMALSVAAENLASVTLLHVVEGSLGVAGPEPYGTFPEAVALRDTLVDHARRRLEEAGRAVQGFCHVSPRVETGRAWQQILRLAETERCDLIVMGAHVKGALERILLGSTAAQVVRHARCPVLVVREALPWRPQDARATATASA
jgi:nucleotide-binding universal stress UspA family protein